MTIARGLDSSLRDLTDAELSEYVTAMGNLVTQAYQAGQMRLSHAYASGLVAGCEEQDRRRHQVEEMRLLIDGPDKGAIYRGEPLTFDD